MPGVVGDVRTGCSFPWGPCDCFPGGLHAFRLNPPACWGLVYMQPAVPTLAGGWSVPSLLSRLAGRPGHFCWSRKGWWEKGRAGLGRGKPGEAVVQQGLPSSPHFWPPVDMAPEGSGGQDTLSAPCLPRAQHLPGVSQGTCSREGPSSESSAAERRPCKNNSKDEAPPAVTLFTIQRTKKLSRKQRRKSVVHISFLHMTSSQGLAC